MIRDLSQEQERLLNLTENFYQKIELIEKALAGATIYANHGTVEEPVWDKLDEPQFSCEAHLYKAVFE